MTQLGAAVLLIAAWLLCVDTNPRPREPIPVIVDMATMMLSDALTVRPEH